MERHMKALQGPVDAGDTITSAMEDRWRKLEAKDIDDDPDVMYYRAHISIKDMYAMKINERMQLFMSKQMQQREDEITRLSKMNIFGKVSN
jgi:hypothetical protein